MKWNSFETTSLITMLSNGMSQREIATMLRRTPKAVERKIHQLRRVLISAPMSDVVRFFDGALNG